MSDRRFGHKNRLSQRDSHPRGWIVIIILFLFPVPVFSQTVENLTCYSTVFEPFVVKSGQIVKGIDVEVTQEVGRRLGIDIHFKLRPWKRLEMDVEKGNVDCVAAYFRTPERMVYMDFTNVPLHITAYTLFVHQKNKRPYKNFEDLQGWEIGINRGFKTPTAFEEAIIQGWIRKYEVSQEDQSLQMVVTHRLQAMLTNYHVGLYNIKKMAVTNVVPLFPAVQSTPAYLVFSKKKNIANLIPQFDEALFAILQDGTYQKIFKKYL